MADVQAPRTRYRSIVADSGRWDGFAFRPGDIVISTPAKCGTTWTQMLCALLIFDGPAFPAPLGDVSPWLDMNIRPLAELPERPVPSDDPVERFRTFVAAETPGGSPTLTSVLQHLDTGWQHRRDPN